MKARLAFVVVLIFLLGTPEIHAFLKWGKCQCPKESTKGKPSNVDTGMFWAKVVCVEDGDTLCVWRDDTQEYEKIRLHGIDCPEGKQSFGAQATEFTRKRVDQEVIRVFPVAKRDKHNRMVADVHYDEKLGSITDGKVLRNELVKEGLAHYLPQYLPKSDPLGAELSYLEAKAKAAGQGLWAQSQVTKPKEYRDEKKQTLADKPSQGSEKNYESETSPIPYTPVSGHSGSTTYEQTDRKNATRPVPSSVRDSHEDKDRTVHVKEYVKKDGTHVREHERRAPSHHHSGSSSPEDKQKKKK